MTPSMRSSQKLNFFLSHRYISAVTPMYCIESLHWNNTNSKSEAIDFQKPNYTALITINVALCLSIKKYLNGIRSGFSHCSTLASNKQSLFHVRYCSFNKSSFGVNKCNFDHVNINHHTLLAIWFAIGNRTNERGRRGISKHLGNKFY